MSKDKPYDFPPILWHKNIDRTLEIMWENLTLLHYDFYQKSFVFDRCVEEHKDIIRKFFALRTFLLVIDQHRKDLVEVLFELFLCVTLRT